MSDQPMGKFISRRHFMRLSLGGMVGLGATSWHALLFAPTNPVVTRHEIEIEGLPLAFDGVRVVQVSDLHFSGLVPREYLERCVRMTNALEPDMIFLTGDFVTMKGWSTRSDTARNYIEPLSDILAPLRARIGRFAVLGNHDVAVGPSRVAAALEKSGIIVLRDQAVAVGRPGSQLPVVGLSDFGMQFVNQTRAFSGIAPDDPALILMHHPDLFEVGMAHRNGLVFAGHTHGGQVRIPFIDPFYQPSRFGAKYLSGRFQDGNLCMLVNRGLGVIHYRIRFNCRPEITLATLRRK